MKRIIFLFIFLALALYVPPAHAIDGIELEGLPVTEDFIYYEISRGEITIRYYASPEADAVIPSEIGGLPVTAIGDFAFWSCDISSITLPETIKSIGRGAFEHCFGLDEITIPASVASIGAMPFLGCSMENIIVAEGNEAYASIDGVLYDKEMTTLIAYPQDKPGESFQVPPGVKTIAGGAFSYNTYLKNVTLPQSVVEIGWISFLLCDSLSEVRILNHGIYFAEDAFILREPSMLTIFAYAGSTSETYAQQQDIPFQTLLPEIPVESIALSPASFSLAPGHTVQLETTLSPVDATTQDIRWTSSDESLATVNGSGEVTGRAPGLVTVMALSTDGSGVSASCAVTVVPIARVSIQSLEALDSVSIRISWDRPRGVDGYAVYRRTGPEGPFDMIAEVTEPTFLDFGLLTPFPTEYYYQMRCYTQADSGERYYGDFGGITSGHTVAMPVAPDVSPEGSKCIRLAWDPVPGATGYKVYRNNSLEDDFNYLEEAPQTLYLDRNPIPGTMYYYRVQAIGEHGPGSVGSYREGRALGVPVISVSHVVLVTGTEHFSVTWSPVEGASGYVVYRGNSKTKHLSEIVQGAFSGFFDTWYDGSPRYEDDISLSGANPIAILPADQTYTYAVRAYQDGPQGRNYGGFSNCVEIIRPQ